ncbi:MAG: cytidine deaminase, partial [Clostridiaceae bacterium]|nr:cytidine deaminase [Clostridiaceae bacterium]
GACIVNKQHKIVSVGYNGMPIGCSDDVFPWDREGDMLETKYPYVCHAELNAILNNVGFNLADCSIYVPLFPCNECAKAIIQSGIREVVYLSDKYAHTDSVRASKNMMEHAGVRFRQLVTDIEELKISYRSSDV